MDIKEAMRQYNEIRRQEKIVADKKKELSKFLKEYAVNHGTKDAKGSSYYSDEDYVIGNVVSTKIKFNQDKARAYMEENFADYLQEVVRTVEYIDEDKLADLVAKEVMTLEDLEQMSDITTSYRVDLREVPKEEEEDRSTVTCRPRVKKTLRARK